MLNGCTQHNQPNLVVTETKLSPLKRKVIRPGFEKNIGYYLDSSSRNYEYQDSSKTYYSTRSVVTYLGRNGVAKSDSI